jgi:hypothetical protein
MSVANKLAGLMHVTIALRISRSVRLQSKHTLKTIIPNIIIPVVPPVPSITQLGGHVSTSVGTAGHRPKRSPPYGAHPYHIIHDPKLADRMMSSLHHYLQSSPTGDDSPSERLQSLMDILPNLIDQHPGISGGLSHETTTTALWGCLSPIISSAVQQIDQTVHKPRYYTARRMFSVKSDSIMVPSPGASPRLLREDKSPSFFEKHASNIVKMGMGTTNGQHGSPLKLRKKEEDHRSIAFSVSRQYSSLPAHLDTT